MMNSRETPSGEVPLSDEEIYRVLQARVDSWDFTEHANEDNLTFAHHIVFNVANNFSYLIRGTSGEFKGEELPTVIKPIWMVPWSPMDPRTNKREIIQCFPRDMLIHLKKREEHQQPPYPEKLHEIMERSETFEKGMDEIKSDPKLMAELFDWYRAEPILDEAIYVTLDEGYGGHNGLRLLVEPGNITLTIFGYPNETTELCNFLTIYHKNIRILSQLAAQLAVLGAKHCRRPNNPQYPSFSLSEADRDMLSKLDISTERDPRRLDWPHPPETSD